jgi:hypothetical protein
MPQVQNPLSFKKITVVKFRAFDRERTESFYDMTDLEIHRQLDDICNTHQVITITDYTQAGFRNELMKSFTADAEV